MEERLPPSIFSPYSSLFLSYFPSFYHSSILFFASFSFIFFLSFFLVSFRFVSFLSEFLEIYRHDDIPSWTRANNWDGFHIGLFNRLQRRISSVNGKFFEVGRVGTDARSKFLSRDILSCMILVAFFSFWGAIDGCFPM